jgi:hypothetical protein
LFRRLKQRPPPAIRRKLRRFGEANFGAGFPSFVVSILFFSKSWNVIDKVHAHAANDGFGE